VKILALSDIGRWSGCERLVERYKPDVAVLPGDLTSDGSAAFWSEGLELVSEFRKQRGILSGLRFASTEDNVVSHHAIYT
jgi:hypothetical protein